MCNSLLEYAYEEEKNLSFVSIDGLLQIQRYTTEEKNATPFSFSKKNSVWKGDYGRWLSR